MMVASTLLFLPPCYDPVILMCPSVSWLSAPQKCDGVLPVEFRSFAVDPQITSLEVLQHILIRAFELSG